MEKITKKEINIFLENLKAVKNKISELEDQLEYFKSLEQEGQQILESAKRNNPELFKHLYS